MSLLKNLAGETAIYGISSMLGRAIPMILLAVYSSILPIDLYGELGMLYAFLAAIYVLFVWRLDSAYFRWANDDSKNKQLFTTAASTVACFTIPLSLLMYFGNNLLGSFLMLSPDQYVLVKIMAIILFFDAINEIPFAQLRQKNKAIPFASIKLIGIIVTTLANVFLFWYIPNSIEFDQGLGFQWFNLEKALNYIFYANLLGSITMTILLLFFWEIQALTFDKQLAREMLLFSSPLVVVSLATIVNEVFDRMVLIRLLPFDEVTNKSMLGEYNTTYKFAVFISLFTQAFRYAAEPFFFKNAENKEAPELYGVITKYFAIVGCLGFLSILIYQPIIETILIRNPDYAKGLAVLPILLLANIFLGLYYNIAVWYKLTDKTRFGMYIALIGAAITVVVNVLFIPTYGYWASAWATLACYGVMTILCYFVGLRHYPLKIQWPRILLYMISSCVIYFVFQRILQKFANSLGAQYGIGTTLIVMFLFVVYFLEKRDFRKWVRVT